MPLATKYELKLGVATREAFGRALAEVAAGLDPARFVRVHRSYVLNVERLARLELYAKDSYLAVLQDGKELPVSRSGHARLKELL